MNRHIHFDSAPNFRDLGGYRTHDGRTVAWRRLFRSAAFHTMNDREVARLERDIGLRAVIDLRTPRDPATNPEVLLLGEIGASYYPVPFSTWPSGRPRRSRWRPFCRSSGGSMARQTATWRRTERLVRWSIG
ncbi:MAG: tyrosine-protein phosphatase [Candidatus Rokubacteria bacterium]|nr:tyrosine-protein phosphatase [Candidatus Rokubacteria bacterium]